MCHCESLIEEICQFANSLLYILRLPVALYMRCSIKDKKLLAPLVRTDASILIVLKIAVRINLFFPIFL